MVAIASVSRVPLIDQLPEVKISLMIAAIVAGIMLFLFVPISARIRTAFWAITALVLFRFFLGASAAAYYFAQPLEISIQEARFGVFIALTPVCIAFLRECTSRELLLFTVFYVAVLLILDLYVYWMFSGDEILIVGSRTASRFFCSVLIPCVTLASAMIKEPAEFFQRPILFVFLQILMAVHSVIITTSRVESLLSSGLLCFIFVSKWPRSQWGILALIFALGLAAPFGLSSDEGGVAGRDYGLAYDLTVDAFPLGYGLVTDVTAKSTLGLPDEFFLSDYGFFLYAIRYGLLGICAVLLLIVYWYRFATEHKTRFGSLLFSVPLLAYFALIPTLDYSSLGGSFVVAMLFLHSPAANCASGIGVPQVVVSTAAA